MELLLIVLLCITDRQGINYDDALVKCNDIFCDDVWRTVSVLPLIFGVMTCCRIIVLYKGSSFLFHQHNQCNAPFSRLHLAIIVRLQLCTDLFLCLQRKAPDHWSPLLPEGLPKELSIRLFLNIKRDLSNYCFYLALDMTQSCPFSVESFGLAEPLLRWTHYVVFSN